MKKVISLILVLVMCLSLFACGNEESKPTAKETKTTVEEAKSTVEEVKKLTLDDIKAMSITQMAKLNVDDVNHFSAAEMNIVSKTFVEKRNNATEEELREYINEFYLKEQPELAPLVEDIFLCFEYINMWFGVNSDNNYQGAEELYEFSRRIKYIEETDYSVYNRDNLSKAIRLLETPIYGFCDTQNDFNCFAFSLSRESMKESIIKAKKLIIETPTFFAE